MAGLVARREQRGEAGRLTPEERVTAVLKA